MHLSSAHFDTKLKKKTNGKLLFKLEDKKELQEEVNLT